MQDLCKTQKYRFAHTLCGVFYFYVRWKPVGGLSVMVRFTSVIIQDSGGDLNAKLDYLFGL